MSVVEPQGGQAQVGTVEPAAALDVRDLEVTFHRRGRDLPVLKGVTLRIEPGEAYGLVGESGCGKTTLAMAACATWPATARSTPEGAGRGSRRQHTEQGGTAQMARRGRRHGLPRSGRGSEPRHAHRRPERGLPLPRGPAEGRGAQARSPRACAACPARPRRDHAALPVELSGGQHSAWPSPWRSPSTRICSFSTSRQGLEPGQAEILDLIEELRGRIPRRILLITDNLGWSHASASASACCMRGACRRGTGAQIFTDPRHPIPWACCAAFRSSA